MLKSLPNYVDETFLWLELAVQWILLGTHYAKEKNGFLLGLTMQWLLHQHRGGIRGEVLNSPQKKEK